MRFVSIKYYAVDARADGGPDEVRVPHPRLHQHHRLPSTDPGRHPGLLRRRARDGAKVHREPAVHRAPAHVRQPGDHGVPLRRRPAAPGRDGRADVLRPRRYSGANDHWRRHRCAHHAQRRDGGAHYARRGSDARADGADGAASGTDAPAGGTDAPAGGDAPAHAASGHAPADQNGHQVIRRSAQHDERDARADVDARAVRDAGANARAVLRPGGLRLAVVVPRG